MAGLRIEDLVERPPVLANPDEPSGRNLPVLTPRLGRTETASREADERVLAVGRPVDALKAWLEAAGIASGPVFRPIDRWARSATPPSTGEASTSSSRGAQASPGPIRRSFRPTACARLPDRGRPPRRAAAGSHAAVAPPLGAAGRRLLPRGGDRTRTLRAACLGLSTSSLSLRPGATIERTKVETGRVALAEKPRGRRARPCPLPFRLGPHGDRGRGFPRSRRRGTGGGGAPNPPAQAPEGGDDAHPLGRRPLRPAAGASRAPTSRRARFVRR